MTTELIASVRALEDATTELIVSASAGIGRLDQAVSSAEASADVSVSNGEAAVQAADAAVDAADRAVDAADRADRISGLEDVRMAIDVCSIPRPDFYLPLLNDMTIREGVGYPYQIDVSPAQDGSILADLPIHRAEYRRNSGATASDATGGVSDVAINVPVFEGVGLTLEGASTNLVATSSRQWSNTTGDTISIGSLTFWETGAGSNCASNNVVSVSAGAAHTVSVFLYSETMPAVVNIHLGGEFGYTSIRTDGSGNTPRLGCVSISDGVYRIYRTETPSVASTWHVHLTGVSNGIVFVGDTQIERMPFMTSQIHTRGTPSTRAAAKLSVPFAGVGLGRTATISFDFQSLMAAPHSDGPSSIFEAVSDSDETAYRFSWGGDGLSVVHLSRDGITIPDEYADGEAHRITIVMTPESVAVFVDGQQVSRAFSAHISGDGYGDVWFGGARSFFRIGDLRVWRLALTDDQVCGSLGSPRV